MEVEWIILADAAEVLNNKLYLLGGGWEALTVQTALPATQHCAVAISFKVPWSETNRRHNIEVELADRDGSQLMQVEGQIEVGRPPGVPFGHAQRVQMAISMGLKVERFGPHDIVTRIEGEDAKRVAFNVVPGSSRVAGEPATEPIS